MKQVIIIRYSEIHLKGNNRGYFEKLLLNNIKRSLINLECNILKVGSRYVISDYTINIEEEIITKLQTVFGIHSMSRAIEIPTSKDNIYNFFNEFILETKTFKVSAKRADKRFEIHTMDLIREIGGVILKHNPNAEVDVHTPDTEINIDIRENGVTYIYYDIIKGLGGMPVGSAGGGLALLSGGIDSPVACFQMAKRGMNITGIHFHSYPYTSLQAKNKVIKLASLIKPYTHINKLIVVNFTNIQENIHKCCNDEYMITIMRRFMVKIAERVANNYNCKALITGESLGQVASQTIESITSTNSVAETLPILRPLIAMDKEEIVEIARKIDTYDTSILPYEDCCTVFLPKYPLIKPKLDKVAKEESKLNVEELIEQALSNLEVIEI